MQYMMNANKVYVYDAMCHSMYTNSPVNALIITGI